VVRLGAAVGVWRRMVGEGSDVMKHLMIRLLLKS